jgi:hypothetical protein
MLSPVIIKLPPQANYAVFYVMDNAQVLFIPIQSMLRYAVSTEWSSLLSSLVASSSTATALRNNKNNHIKPNPTH